MNSMTIQARTVSVPTLPDENLNRAGLDPQRIEWIFTDEHGHQVRTQPAEQISRERIETLTVSNHRKRGAAKPCRDTIRSPAVHRSRSLQTQNADLRKL
jgi:hypothetical protein